MPDIIENIRTMSVRIKNKEQLPLGNKSRGRFIKTGKGQPDILIPSYGLLEKEEIDYIAEANIEKDKDRVRRTPMKENLEKVTKALLNAPQGERRKLLNEIKGESNARS